MLSSIVAWAYTIGTAFVVSLFATYFLVHWLDLSDFQSVILLCSLIVIFAIPIKKYLWNF